MIQHFIMVSLLLLAIWPAQAQITRRAIPHDELGIPTTAAGDPYPITTRSGAGSTCTAATLNTAITAIGSTRATLPLPPRDGGQVACTWTLESNVTTNANTFLLIAGPVSINAGVTLTINGPHQSLIGTRWYSGDGTLVINERAWSVDGNSSYVESGCAPAVPGASLTFGAFACRANIVSNSLWTHVNQAAASVTVPNSAIVWVAVHRDTTTTVAGWTREAGTHYLTQASATKPAEPAGGIIVLEVAVSGGVISSRFPIASRDPNGSQVHNVQNFGAVADSSTDNLTAFNLARDAACGNVSGSRSIYIPPGVGGYYALSAAWVITGCSGVQIEGGGWRSQLVATGTDDVIRLANNNSYTIRGLSLGGVVGSRDGIRIGTANSPQANPSHYGYIEDVYCRGVDGNCISNLSGILTTIVRPKFSLNFGPAFPITGPGTAKIGIYIPDNSSGFNNGFVIISPLIEGMGTHGIDLGGGMAGGYIGGGTVEGNGNRAGSLGNATHANIRSAGHTGLFIGDGIFLEQNNDVERNIILTTCISCTLDTVYAGSNAVSPRGDIEINVASGLTLTRVYTNQVTINSTSVDVDLRGVTTGTQVGGTVTDSGTRTTISKHQNSSNANFKLGGKRLDSPINLATNPSFEWWTSTTGLQNWAPSNGTVTRIGTGEATTDRRCGRYAARLTPTAGQGTVYLGLRITDTPELAPPETRYEHALLIGQPVTVTFFAKRAAGTQPGTVRWSYDGGGTLDTQGLTGISTSWQKFQMTALVRTGTTSLDIQIASNQGVVDNAMILDLDCVTVTVGDTGSTPAFDNVGRPGEGVQLVTFSATPTFYADAADFFRIVMTANITGVTISNGRLGQTVCILWQQDGTGGRTVTGFAASIELTGGAITPTAGANKATMQCFRYDGVSYWETSRAGDQN